MKVARHVRRGVYVPTVKTVGRRLPYIYEGFGALLNKSRSANVGVVFSHQALGDLEKVGPAFKNVVLTNTNVKVIMRNNNPDTCEYFAKSLGTQKTSKVTERQEKTMFGTTRSGDGSVRDVEEYQFHPNLIKQLGVGQGIVSIPHHQGLKNLKISFERRPDIEPVPLPSISKSAFDFYEPDQVEAAKQVVSVIC